MTETTLRDRRTLDNLLFEALKDAKTISLDALLDKELKKAQPDETQGTPIFDLPSAKDLPEKAWGTTLEVTEAQAKSFQSARSEVDKRRQEVAYMDKIYPGLLAEYDEYIKAEGNVGFFGTLDRRMAIAVESVSAKLQAPSYGVGAAIEAAIIEDARWTEGPAWDTASRGSAVWEGYQAFMSEMYAGYAPGREGKSRSTDISALAQKWGLIDAEPRKITKEQRAEAKRLGLSIEVIEDFEGDLAKASEALNWTAALLGTIFIDPLNLMPIAGVAAVPGKIYRAAKGTSAGKPMADILEYMFKMHPELPAEHRQALLNIRKRFGAKAENEIVSMLDEIDSMVAWMSPRERRLLGTTMDQPELMEKQIDAFIEGGLIISENGPKLKEYAIIIRAFTKKLFDAEVAAPLGGVIDPAMLREFYLHGTLPKDPRLVKAFEKVSETRRPEQIRTGEGPLPGTEAVPGFAKGKSYPNQLDRAIASIRGDVAYGTELDIGNILRVRSVESVRHIVSRQFGEAVLTNPEIATRIDFDPRFFNADIPRIEGNTWQDIKNTIETPIGKQGPAGEGRGMSVYEIKKKVKVSDDLETGAKYREEIIGAYMLPNEVYNFLVKSEDLIGNAKQLTQFGKAFDDLTNIWKGWATFGTGYHARNFISIMNSNWMAGVGRNAAGRFSLPEYMLRNLQALKLMSVAKGAGRLPKKTLDRANKIARKYGWDSLDAVPDIAIKNAEGRILSYSEIANLGESLGVPQVATAMYNTEAGAAEIMWKSNIVDMPAEISKKIDPKVAEVMGFAEGEGLPLKDMLSKAVGQQNPAIKLNRAAAQIIENQGRWTLFLDSLAKGMPAEAAAEMPRLWHFDYRMLTDFEKKTFRRIIPFYAWQRFAAPRVMMAILENPGRIAQMPKAKQAIESLYPEFAEADTPDYWDEVLAWQLPYMNQDNMPVAAQIEIPFAEINKLNFKDFLSSLNPIIGGPIQMYLNQDFFMGGSQLERWEGQMPVRYENEDYIPVKDRLKDLMPWLPEELIPDIDLTRKEEWLLGKGVPPLGKLSRFLDAQSKGTGSYQLLSELSGIKLRLLDERRVFRGRTYKRRKFGREFMNRLEERARSDEELAKLFPHLKSAPKYKPPSWLYLPRE